MWKRRARAAFCCQESWWNASSGLGTLDGQAALALESIDIKDMCTEGGEELVSSSENSISDSRTRWRGRSHGGSLWAENHDIRDDRDFHWTTETLVDPSLVRRHELAVRSSEELEDRVEDKTHDYVEFGDDAEFESEFEAILGALESDAIEQTRTGMTQAGKAHLRAEGAHAPTLEWYVNHQKRSKTRSPKKRVQAPGNDASVRVVSCWSCWRLRRPVRP